MRTWIKQKYTEQKRSGRYKSKHNDNTKRRARRKITSESVKSRIRATQPLVTMVLLPNGKRRFERETRDD